MSIPVHNNLDLNKNAVENAVIQVLSTAPVSPSTGQIYFDSVLGYARIWDGSSWVRMKGNPVATAAPTTVQPDDAAAIGSSSEVALADHTHGIVAGPAGASAPGDTAAEGASTSFARADHRHSRENHGVAEHSSLKLSDFASPTAALNINSQRLTNVADPTSAQDAATKAYVDASSQGLDVKDSVRAATTGNITLSGTQTIDGVSVVANDRVLVKNQTAGQDNGIYVVAAGAWARSDDADSSADVTAGMFTFVEEGTTNADSGWVLTTNDPITLGTTSLAFTQFTGAGQVTAGAGLTKSGNTLDVGAGAGVVVNANDVTLDWGEDADIQDVVPGAAAAAGVANEVARADHTHAVPTGAGGLVRYFRQTITGDGTTTDFVVTHNFNERWVIIQVSATASPYDTVLIGEERTTVNTCTIKFAIPPANNVQYEVLVVG